MAPLSRWSRLASVGLTLIRAFLPAANAYDLDPDSDESAKSIASHLAEDMLLFYHGDEPGHSPGLLELPYYWWYGGAMFGALIDYWYYTGDARWNDLVMEGMLTQVGDEWDYMPETQTLTEGNDDQGFWGLAAMSAAEYNFPNPPADKPQWLALAQAVFNTQASRWDTRECNGGLRWQIFTWNRGYDYKNSISQACFFALAARLALFTGNMSYADWAERSWDWMVEVKFLDTETYYVVDGAGTLNGCSEPVPYQWTYNAGGFLLGAAAMYNLTGSDKWKERIDGMVSGTDVFFTGDDKDIMTEVACEPVNFCNFDQESFKAYLSRWLAVSIQWAPHIASHVKPRLRASAVAAAQQCTGGDNGRMCGLKWANNSGRWDGTTGLGHQMAALEVVLTQLLRSADPPLGESTGATSPGDPTAGGNDIGRTEIVILKPVTTADRVGAAILTVGALAGLLAGVVFVMWDETTDRTVPERWQDFRHETKQTSAVGVAAMLQHRRTPSGGSDENDEKGTGGMKFPVTEPPLDLLLTPGYGPHPNDHTMGGMAEGSGRYTPPLARDSLDMISIPPITPRGFGRPAPVQRGTTSTAALMAPSAAIAQSPLPLPLPLPPKPARVSRNSSNPVLGGVEPAWSAQPHRPGSSAGGRMPMPEQQVERAGVGGRRRTLVKQRAGENSF